MPSQTIRVRQHSFTIRAPYEAGQVLAPTEARALNSLRAENIRNAAGREFKARSGEAETLTGAELEAFQAWVAEYDRLYVFSRGGPIRRSGFERLLRTVAEEEAQIQVNRTGRELASDEFEALVAELMALESLQHEAQRRLERSQEIAEAELMELIQAGAGE